MFLPFPKNPKPTAEEAVTLAVVVMLPVAVVFPVWSPTSAVDVRLLRPVIVVGSRAFARVPVSTFVALSDVTLRPFPKNPRPTPEDAVTLAVVVRFPVAVVFPVWSPTSAVDVRLLRPVIVVGSSAFARVPESTFVALSDVTLRPFPKNPKPTPEDAVTLAVVVTLAATVSVPPM